MEDSKVSEGRIPFHYNGETYHTWYKLFGDVSTQTRPLVVLHGGPGLSHDYMLPLGDLSRSPNSRPVILYDQLGNARSTHLSHKDPSFWTIDLFIDELVNVLSHFGIEQNFDLLGHSWGGMLGAEFCIRRQPAGLKHLVLADTLASKRLAMAAIVRLRKLLPEDVQAVFREREAVGDVSCKEYKDAAFKFYEQFACRMKPMPEPLLYSLKQPEEDRTVLAAMSKGELGEKWDIIDKLHTIRVPALLINGKYDFEADEVCSPFFWRMEKIKWVQFTESSHVPHWEERERYMEVVATFLKEV